MPLQQIPDRVLRENAAAQIRRQSAVFICHEIRPALVAVQIQPEQVDIVRDRQISFPCFFQSVDRRPCAIQRVFHIMDPLDPVIHPYHLFLLSDVSEALFLNPIVYLGVRIVNENKK